MRRDAARYIHTPMASGERLRAMRAALFAGAVLLGSTRLSNAADFQVTNLNDMGAGSLRQAILDANTAGGADTISFAPGLTGTISLAARLTITDTVVITGPGAGNLRIAAAGATTSLVYIPGDAGNVDDITLSGLTLDGGGTNVYGARMANEILRLNGVTVTGCAAGAVKANDATLEILSSVITNNGNASAGVGGIYSYITGTTVRGCTISGNAGYAGGIKVNGAVTALVEDTTISNNISSYSGGGVSVFGSAATLRNVTISGNTALVHGAGVYTYQAATNVTIQNSTISGNSSSSLGGGVYGYSGTLSLESTIVAGNTGGGNPNDLARKVATVNVVRSLIGAVAGGQINGTNTDNLIGVDAKLSPLQSNGGPRLTHLPLTGSPAIDAGSNPAALTNDGRGAGFPRQLGAGVDIGAVEVDAAAPTATLSATAVDNTSPAAQYDFTVTFTSTAGISIATLGNANVRVTGPGGFDVAATFVSVNAPTNGSPRVATYRITPPGGTWDAADNGQYTISLVASQVADVNGAFVPGGALGGFGVNIARSFVVTTLADNGAGSLRQAVIDANGALGADQITFQAGLTGSVVLTTGVITISEAVSITGPGASALTVSGNNASGILFLDGGLNPQAQEIQISGLTLSGSANGQALYSVGENVTLQDAVISGNASGNRRGGGAYFRGGKVTIQRCGINGNSTSRFGGAFYSNYGAQMLIEDTTISGNSGTNGAGAFFLGGSGVLTLRRCTLSGNSTNVTGGAIHLGFASFATLENSTITGNTANKGGGGIYLRSNAGSLAIRNCTIAGNIADNDDNDTGDLGGGIGFQGTTPVTIDSSIVADNIDRAGTANEIEGPVTANFSLIEDPTGATITGANNILNQDPQLAALANNGGLTQTRAISATSPALNAGSNPGNLTSDQRGPGFGRVSGPAADIGAFEIDATAPTAVLTAPNVTADSPATQYDFIVTYNDTGFIDASSLGNGNVRVTGPNGFDAAATFVSSNPAVNGSPLAVTYRITPPGGAWDKADDGTYTVALQSGQVKDISGNVAAAAVLGTFNVTINTAPVLGAIVATPAAPIVGQAVVFSVPATDADGDPLTFAWTFGDGGTSTEQSPSRAFSALGAYIVQVTASDGKGGAATATLSLTVTTPGGSLDPNDNDGDGIANASDPDDDNDGFSDEFETALGTDPLAPTSSPSGGVVTPVTLSLAKLGISLNFAKGGTDKITLSGSLPVPAGFTIANAKVALNVGGVIKPFTLSSKGAAKAGNDSFKIGIKAKKGVVAAQTSKFSAAFSKGTFPAAFTDEGLTNAVAKKDPRTVRVEILFSNALYRKDQPQVYTAGKGKGKTK